MNRAKKVLTCLTVLVGLGIAINIFRFGEHEVKFGAIIQKSVSELLKLTVLEMIVVSDPSTPTQFTKKKGCVTNLLCAGSYWAVLDWRAIVRMSYDLSTISQSNNSCMQSPTDDNSQVWELCLPPLAVDVELQAENVNFRIRRVGALLDNQEAASWEQEMFQSIRTHVRKCYAQNDALRDRAKDVLKTKLDKALLSVRSKYNVIVNYSFANDTEVRLSGGSFQQAAGAVAVGSQGLLSLPTCDFFLNALHAQ